MAYSENSIKPLNIAMYIVIRICVSTSILHDMSVARAVSLMLLRSCSPMFHWLIVIEYVIYTLWAMIFNLTVILI